MTNDKLHKRAVCFYKGSVQQINLQSRAEVHAFSKVCWKCYTWLYWCTTTILICDQSIGHQIPFNMFHKLCLCQYWRISVPSYQVFELIKLERNEANTKISNANAYRMYQPYLFYFTEASFNRTIFLCSLYLNIVNILKNSATTTKIFNTTQSYF